MSAINISKKINHALNLIGLRVSRVPSRLFNDITLPLPKSEYELHHDKILLKRLNIIIPKEVGHPLVVEYDHSKRIVEQLKGVFYYDNNGHLKVKVDNVELYINVPGNIINYK